MIPEQLKKPLIAFLLSLIAFAAVVVAYLGGEPDPLPLPEPSTAASSAPSGPTQISWEWDRRPLPGEQLQFGDQANVSGSRGETIGLVMKATTDECVTGSDSPTARVRLYEMATVTTTKPSYIGLPVGSHYDPLIPRESVCKAGLFWADLEIKRDAVPGAQVVKIGSATVNLTVWKMVMPVKPTMPFYMGAGTWAMMLGHYGKPPATGTYPYNQQAPLGKKYMAELRAHRIEPFGTAVTSPPYKADGSWDVDAGGEASFRKMVLDGRIAPPVLIGWGTKDEDLAKAGAAAEKLIQSEGLQGAWSYILDEPNTDAERLRLFNRATSLKSTAPSLLRLATSQPTAQLDTVMDGYIAVYSNWMNQWAKPPSAYKKPWRGYEACMPHGCGGAEPTASTGVPDVGDLDVPAIENRLMPIMGRALDFVQILYYNTVEAYGKMDPWLSIYLFKGNGDGTFFYPGKPGEHGLTEHQPIPSVRLKLYRTGMYDVEYDVWAQAKGLPGLKTLVRGTKDWDKNNGSYQAWRNQTGAKLNAL